MRYALYAANTDETSDWLDDLKNEVAGSCGGYTAYEAEGAKNRKADSSSNCVSTRNAEGGWTDDDGNLVTDDVLVVETYTQGRDEIAFNLLKDYAHFIVGETSEDSVMVVAGDEPVYIE